MAMMRSPEGAEKDIAAGGVAALVALGWVVVEPPAPERTPPKQTRK